MNWTEILLNLVCSFIASFLSALLIKCIIEKSILLKKKILDIYLTFCKFENKKVCDIGMQEINDFLCECRIVLVKKQKLYKLFEHIDINIMSVLRSSSCSNNLIIKTDGKDYFDFKLKLEKYLGL